MDTSTAIGPLMLDLSGTELTSDEQLILQNPKVGGVILFSRNYETPSQLLALVKSIRKVAPNLLIAVDHEGGRVQRFKEGFTRIPAMAVFGQLFKDDPGVAITLAKECGWILASELICFDIDMSFAPVLDVDYGESGVIGDRAFSNQTDAIVALSIAFIEGMREAGMASTGKHFPGHGGVKGDSHFELPVDTRSLEELQQQDMRIFNLLALSGLNAVMPAHVVYPNVDDQPAGFSVLWLEEILRGQLNFDGLVFSDDLGMAGAEGVGTFPERAAKALQAGCDMILVCNKPYAAKEVLDYLVDCDYPLDCTLSSMRHKCANALSLEELQQTKRWKTVSSKMRELCVALDEQLPTVGE